jgi:chemotaxis protein MotA
VDFATLLGVGGAFAMIAGAMALSGQAAAFLDVPSILIVIGGTFLVTTMSFSLSEIGQAQGLMFRAAIYHAESPENAVIQALYLADLARKRGRLALQSVTDKLLHSPFLYRATPKQFQQSYLPTQKLPGAVSLKQKPKKKILK